MTREESVQDLYVDVQRRSVALKASVSNCWSGQVRLWSGLVWSDQVSQVRQASKQAGKGGGITRWVFQAAANQSLNPVQPNKKMNRPDAEWQR
jgi:hypothetical protein